MPPESDDSVEIVETDPTGRYQRYRELLGTGSFKSVYKAFDSELGREVAWNQVRVDKLGQKQQSTFLEEVTLLRSLQHRNIIMCYYYWEDREKKEVNFITELMTSGTLKSFIKKKKVNLRIIRNWSFQILQALDYLHTHDTKPIIHRDLKCDNMFINGNLGEVKLGDLGLSTTLEDKFAQSVIGTPEFMAPELYEEKYTEKVDIYAFGMCILEIFTGQYPYSECSNAAQIYKKVTQGLPPASLIRMENVAVKHFIQDCLKSEDQRPSAKELLMHPFLQDPEALTTPIIIPEEPNDSFPVLRGSVALEAVAEGEGEEGGQEDDGEATVEVLDMDGREVTVTEISGGQMVDTEVVEPEAQMTSADASPFFGRISIQATIDDKPKVIEFDFDTQSDTVEKIARDLIEETGLDAQFEILSQTIRAAVEDWKASHLEAGSHTTPPENGHVGSGETVGRSQIESSVCSPTTGNMDVLESPTDVSTLSSGDDGEHFESDTQPEAPSRASTELTRQQPGSVGITRLASQTPTQPVITSRPSIELTRPTVQQQQQPLAVAQQAPVVKSSRTELTRPAQQQQTHEAPQQQQAVASHPSIERTRPVALQQQQQAAPATDPPSLLSLDTQGSEIAVSALQQTTASWPSSENFSCSTSNDSQVISMSSTVRQQAAEPLEMHTKPRPELLLPRTPPANGASDSDAFVVNEVALLDRTDFGSTKYRDAVIGIVSGVQDESLLLDRLLLEADQRMEGRVKELVSQYREDVRKALSVGTQEGEPSDSEVEQHVRNSFSDALDRHLRPGEAAEVRMDSL